MQDNTPRAITRTWAADVVYRECGTVTGSRLYTVTMTRTAQGFTAEIDGQPAGVLDAARILGSADRVTVTHEVLDTVAAQIGKAAAYELHKELGRLKYRDHYATASAALERPVSSLAALTPEQAVTVRSFAYGQLGLVA